MTERDRPLPDGFSDVSPQEHDIVVADEDRRDRTDDEDTGRTALIPGPEPRTFVEAIDVDSDQQGGKG